MRICLWGGPGCGKSRTAARLYSDLKVRGVQIELIQEWIKRWAYAGRQPRSFEQVVVFSEQLRLEDELHLLGVEHIVTDSPLLLQCVYAELQGFRCVDQLRSIALEYEAVNPSLNVFLDRTGIAYETIGRHEDSEEAKVVDEMSRRLLQDAGLAFTVLRTLEYDSIVDFVSEKIGAARV